MCSQKCHIFKCQVSAQYEGKELYKEMISAAEETYADAMWFYFEGVCIYHLCSQSYNFSFVIFLSFYVLADAICNTTWKLFLQVY